MRRCLDDTTLAARAVVPTVPVLVRRGEDAIKVARVHVFTSHPFHPLRRGLSFLAAAVCWDDFDMNNLMGPPRT